MRILDEEAKKEITKAKAGQTIIVELRAALNQNRNAKDKGWVEISTGKDQMTRLELIETGHDTGIFVGKYTVPGTKVIESVAIGYGYLGFRKERKVDIDK